MTLHHPLKPGALSPPPQREGELKGEGNKANP